MKDIVGSILAFIAGFAFVFAFFSPIDVRERTQTRLTHRNKNYNVDWYLQFTPLVESGFGRGKFQKYSVGYCKNGFPGNCWE